ncbi:SDR family oxidoreductase [Streptomyces sp. V4I2]|uniref:SDR family oxidoreductase n=1 Tax=Streptomyces sp. V4I2 TaxID=3042280 RepID=UPI002782D9B4|nr:SDR family oxidoreductase [Streptomyces sp. V4I2]MDQ1047523.1 3-oxoacyl-[acyl-carrier protein] reductase [Streptomyces sp. V4I2]
MSLTRPTTPVALVTGGAGGIGSAVCQRLASDGYYVVVGAYTGVEPAEELAATIEKEGGAAEVLQFDVKVPERVTAAFSQVMTRHKRLDAVINNAGTTVPRPLADLDDTLYDRIFDVNVRGALNVLREASRHLADWGRVVNISSTLVRSPIAGSGAYAASKAALELFSTVAAQELGPRGITVNALRVGPTVPGMFSQAPVARQAAMAEASPFKRLGQPQDVADVISFLVSDAGRWITGQVITVDGGTTS